MICAPIPASNEDFVIDFEAALTDHEDGNRFNFYLLSYAHAGLVQNDHILVFCSDDDQALTFIIFNSFVNRYHARDVVLVTKLGATRHIRHR